MPPPPPGDSSGSNARDARAAARDAARKQARPETTDKPTTSGTLSDGRKFRILGTRVVEPPVESRQDGGVGMPPALKQFIEGLSPTERATLTPTQIISRAAARGII